MLKTAFILLFLICLLGAESGALPDPTAPSGWANTSVGPLSGSQGYILSSLLISPSRKIAIINRKTVREGDSINGKKVVKISRDGVLLQGQGGEQSWLLKMFVKEIKKLP